MPLQMLSRIIYNFQPPDALTEVSSRSDELGQLARVFTNMVKTVKIRETELLEANQQPEKLLKAYSRFVLNDYLRDITFL
jgi:adenylate cyclase